MSRGSYERLTTSAAGTAFKTFLHERAPLTATRFQRAIRAARRSFREPESQRLSDAQLLWNPPPRRSRDWPLVAGDVTNRLFSRLSDEDLALMLRRLAPEDAASWQRADESERRLLALHFCVHYGVPGVLERTGLSAAEPPADVTAMARGSHAAGGSFYYGDLIADTLKQAGVDLSTRRRALDFGCSSGRVLRVLAATYPDVEWFGCDPDGPAVAWAAANLNGAQFSACGVEPPLPFPDKHFDLVFAISIWTHYSELAARRWLDEMQRVIAPGGHLLLTAAGYRSVELYTGDWAGWPPELIAETATALYTDGHKFVGGYGKHLSLAESSPDWGEAFFTPEWLADNATPAWAILNYLPGFVEAHHDLYLLERRSRAD
jgi:SAM-dependent methyltransferase